MGQLKKGYMRPVAVLLTFCMITSLCAVTGVGELNSAVAFAQNREGCGDLETWAAVQEQVETDGTGKPGTEYGKNLGTPELPSEDSVKTGGIENGDSCQPEVGKAGAGQDASGKLEDGGTTEGVEQEQPEVEQPEKGQPEVEQPEKGQPEVEQPEKGQPEVEQPEKGQPEVEQPEVEQPEKDHPEVEQPDIEQPGQLPSEDSEEPHQPSPEVNTKDPVSEEDSVKDETSGDLDNGEAGKTDSEADRNKPEEPEQQKAEETSNTAGTWMIARFKGLSPNESRFTFKEKPALEDIQFPATLAAEVCSEDDEEQRMRNADIPVEWLCSGYEEGDEDEYIFTAEWDTTRYTSCEDEAPEITVWIEDSAPGSLRGWADGIEVEIRALDGELGIPGGAQLRVTKVTAEDELEAIREAVEAEAEAVSGEAIKSIIPLDIEILFEGEVVQPQGEIQVIVRNVPDGSAAQNKVFYVTDDRAEAQDMNAEQTEAEVAFEAGHFSTYAIVQYTSMEHNPQVEVGEGKTYESLQGLLDNLGDDTGILTVVLAGDTADTETVVFPRDKGIGKIIITGDSDYCIGGQTPVDVCANGIPMVYEAGTAKSVVGGGYNTGVESTRLTVKGGKFRYCVGGNLVDQNGVQAEIPGGVRLAFEDMDCGLDEGYNSIYNQVYSGTMIDGLRNDIRAGIDRVELKILDSHLAFDIISGGGYLGNTGSTYEAPIGEVSIVIDGSQIFLGDGIFGGHLINGGGTKGIQMADYGDVDITITDSYIDGDIFAGPYATSEAEADLGNLRIYVKDSTIGSVHAGGCYQGHFQLKVGDIQIILDNCRVGATHLFTEEFSMIDAGLWVGEELIDPEMYLHIQTGSVQYTFLNSVTDADGDDGEPGLYLFPAGYVEYGITESIGRSQLTLSAQTEFMVTNGDLNVLEMVPPEGRHFTTAMINDMDQQLDSSGRLRIQNLAEGSIVAAELGELTVKDQPPLVIEGIVDGKVEKVLGEPDFILDVTGGAPGLRLEYHSSDPSVAEITAEGVIHLKKAGTAAITVSSESIEYRKTSASVNLTVIPAPALLIPEELPEDQSYVLVAKPVAEEETVYVHEALAAYSQISETANIIAMDIKLVERSSGENVDGVGATFTIAYPSKEIQQNREAYDFYVLHIPAPGEEYLVPLSLTDKGIRITVNGFSPFILAYEKKTAGAQGGKTVGHEESGGDEAVSGRWISDANGWWYQYPGGTWPSAQWAYLECNGTYAWYYFDKNGYMADGWLNLGESWYFLHNRPDGTRGYMYTGCHEIDGRQYYFETRPGADYGKLIG